VAKVLFCLPSEQSSFAVCETVLRDLGHQIQTFYYRTLAYQKRGYSSRIFHRIWHVDDVAMMNNALISEVQSFRPDVLLVFKGEILFAETIRRISREFGVRTASYYVDSPMWVGNSTLHILNGLQFFDVVFVFDGHYVPEVRRLGCRKVEVLPFCCEPSIHRPIKLTPEERREYGSPICFVGNNQGAYCPREKILEALLGFDLKVWGTGWEKSSPSVRGRWAGRAAVGLDMARVYSASEITFNVTYPHSITQPNMRTFEAPACGILMINDDLEGVPQFFTVGREIDIYRSISELKEKLRFYLDHPEDRRRMAEAGRERAHRDHTYHLRMRQMMDCILEAPGR
jgi:spore maturation protein CgeB